MSKKNRGDNSYYVTHLDRWGKADGAYSYISVLKDGSLLIRHRPIDGSTEHRIDRRHARLLAKRILQALEDTK